MFGLGFSDQRGRLKSVAWHERLVTEQTQPAGRQAYSGYKTQGLVGRSASWKHGGVSRIVSSYPVAPDLPHGCCRRMANTSFPGSSAFTAAAHTYTPQHSTTRPLSASSSSSCLSIIVTYHTGRLEGSGGQEGLGHGQAQERNQEREGPHGCRLPVVWTVGERTCVSGDWVRVGGERVS